MEENQGEICQRKPQQFPSLLLLLLLLLFHRPLSFSRPHLVLLLLLLWLFIVVVVVSLCCFVVAAAAALKRQFCLQPHSLTKKKRKENKNTQIYPETLPANCMQTLETK